ncbi:hypothetical protein [Hymenobacter koreensis]|uniref:Lipoprotein n=1 Tax=Hymenobacter koreensis TaxID=1084523 RepID=A0ABP8ITI1_9BACT
MKQTLTLWLALIVLATSVPALTSCARRTTQQKKTAAFKRKAKGGKTPCPCDSH